MTTSISKRLTAAVGALALGILGAVAVATPASATPVTPVNVGNITGESGSLTIHKYERTADSPLDPGTGEQIPGFTGIGLDGVEFTVQKVTTPALTTTAGWDAVEAIADAADPIAAATTAGLTPVTSVTTANGGVATANLPYALYLVTETNSPSTVTDKAAPFLVTIPFPTGPDAENPNEWIYDVHVYPKNGVTDLEKTVVAPTAGELAFGDLVRWQIVAGVPVLADGEELSEFVVRDQLDPAQLAFVTDAQATALGIAPSSVIVTDGSNAPVALVAGDYSIAPVGANELAVTFTASGLTKLAGAQGGTVTFTVLTQVKAIPANGVIENDAISVVNDSELTASTTTTVGQLRVLKYAKTDANPEVPLTGAKFALFLDEAGTKPVTVAGASEWTTAAGGLLNIPSLRPGTYWLVETAAPAGYVLDATPRQVQVVAGQATTSVNFVKVENEQVPAWELPLTGGDGALWFGVGGAALVAITVGAAVLISRRAKANA
ncbi:SpaH/EbpB family LPXTG-anchored major pilin [Microbacterium sp. LMI12-1-1.1]|uniref:SpaH/EbpB family LPXTG-anchored major pilin n=1 Tax=Microbacterium sp. LMI12-1-1.1 TaxID=3135225 RepID=UPI00344AD451